MHVVMNNGIVLPLLILLSSPLVFAPRQIVANKGLESFNNASYQCENGAPLRIRGSFLGNSFKGVAIRPIRPN